MTLRKHSLGLEAEILRALSDEELMRHASVGHHDAITVLFDRYHLLVFDVAVRIVRDPAEAEDVVQNVFLDVFRAMANFDSRKGILKVWILQYAYHRALHRKRHLVSNHFYSWENLEAAVEVGSGQLGGAQMCELDELIAHCERCRKYLESVAQVSVQVMPLLAEKHAPDRRLVPPPGMRERFLARLASEPASGENGKSLRPFSPADALQERPRFKLIVEEKLHQVTRSKARFAHSFWRPLAITTACLVAVASAYYAGTRKTVQPPAKLAEVHPSAPPP